MELKTIRHIRRKKRVRSKIFGSGVIPRLSVFRSNTHIYGQIINDEKGTTLVSFSDLNLKERATGPERSRRTKVQTAEVVGEGLAKKAKLKKIKKVVFDRNGLRYHGRVKALAEGARKGGLTF